SWGIIPFWVRSGSFSPTTRPAVIEEGRGGGPLLRGGGSGSSMRGGGLLRGVSIRGGGLRSSCGGGRRAGRSSRDSSSGKTDFMQPATSSRVTFLGCV